MTRSEFNTLPISRVNQLSVGDAIERVTTSFPDKEAIVAWDGAYAYNENHRVSYDQADKIINKLANALLDFGLRKGDRVLFFSENSTEAFLFKMAVAKAGLVNAPANVNVADDIYEYYIELVDPSFIVSDDEFVSRVEPILEKFDKKIDVVIPINKKVDGYTDFKKFIEKSSSEAPEIVVKPDDIWEILFTSGTTSKPKGVMISHQYTYLAGFNYGTKLNRYLPFEGQYKIISFLPTIYHVADQTLPLSAFLQGGTLILGRRYDKEQLALAITSEKPTAFWAGSAEMLRDSIDFAIENKNTKNIDYSSITSIIYGYAAFPVKYSKLVKEVFGENTALFASFAQSECISGYRMWHEEFEDIYESYGGLENILGVPDPLLQSKLMDDEGHIINEPHQVGEVVLKSPCMFSGYYKNPEATEKAFKNGWFRSGDNAYFDNNGVAIMVDRSKDIIKSGGETVSSVRVESTLKAHPSVSNAVVIGLPDKRWGEAVTGIVISKEEVSEQELIDFCRERLAGFETPKKILFRESFPESVAGKIKKSQLKKEYLK